MPSAPPHNRLVAQAAKEVLAPLGLKRVGRSRTWLDDHGWWLGVVEFQPSSWARGTFLNVGAMLMVGEPQAFRDEVNGWIARYREALRLPPAAPV